MIIFCVILCKPESEESFRQATENREGVARVQGYSSSNLGKCLSEGVARDNVAQVASWDNEGVAQVQC